MPLESGLTGSSRGYRSDPMIKPFISHSSRDRTLAEALVELVRAALRLPSRQIRCTSVEGYKLRPGAKTDEQLRRELRASKAFVGLITPSSIASVYVLCELGARWGASLPHVPLLARGATAKHLPGPLHGLNAISCSSRTDLHDMIDQLADVLHLKAEPSSAWDRHLAKVMERSRKRRVATRARRARAQGRPQSEGAREGQPVANRFLGAWEYNDKAGQRWTREFTPDGKCTLRSSIKQNWEKDYFMYGGRYAVVSRGDRPRIHRLLADGRMDIEGGAYTATRVSP